MNPRTPIRNAIWAVTILLAFGTLGSNGSCADMAGPNYGPGNQGGYGQPGSGGGQTYNQPTFNNYRVDWCLNWGANCGGPAATEFCHRMGYSQATAWTQAQNIGSFSPTLLLGDGAVCNQPGCDGFDSITCTSGGAPPGQGGGQQQGTFFEEPGTDRPGMNYRNVVLNNPDPKNCKNLCRKDGAVCRAFTYVNPGVQGPQARCYLKNGVPAPVADNCCHSGVKK
ncbi:MAG: PAN domain-containing protein [Deltaproteobacteria bacterium]|nr:PAN domain-containing protein [Deltaproteobacteria bacterium]